MPRMKMVLHMMNTVIDLDETTSSRPASQAKVPLALEGMIEEIRTPNALMDQHGAHPFWALTDHNTTKTGRGAATGLRTRTTIAHDLFQPHADTELMKRGVQGETEGPEVNFEDIFRD